VGYRNAREEVVMLATTSTGRLDTRCPLCGVPLLSVDGQGYVEAEILAQVPLHRNRDANEGFVVCEQCAVLTRLPHDMTLN
jgi:hypothetical protein